VQYSLWYIVPNPLPIGDLVTEELRNLMQDMISLPGILIRYLLNSVLI